MTMTLSEDKGHGKNTQGLEPRTENKKLSLGKTVLKMWSLIWQKNDLICP